MRKNKRRIPILMTAFSVLLIVLAAIVFARIDAEADSGMETPSPTPEATEAASEPPAGNEQVVIPEISTPPSIPEAEQQESVHVTEPPDSEPPLVERYAAVVMTDEELRELAGIIYHEARNQSAEGQQAIAEVVLNRVIADNFPNSVHDVIYQGAEVGIQQFATVGLLGTAEPTKAQYDAIEAALYGPSILPDDVVYFSGGAENDRVWGRIGDHVFCRQYEW